MKLFNAILAPIELAQAEKKCTRERIPVAAPRSGKTVMPVVHFQYWTFTMEACLLTGELGKAVREVFYSMPEPIQHALTFSPESGGWVDRAKLWQTVLKLTLPPRQYYTAMQKILGHYVRVVHWCGEHHQNYPRHEQDTIMTEVGQCLCECYRKGAAGEPRPFAKDFRSEIKGMSERTNIPLERLGNNRGIKQLFELGNKAYEDGAKLGRVYLESRLPG